MSQDFKIGNVNYMTRKFPAREGLALHMKLIGTVSSSLGGLFETVSAEGASVDVGKLAPHITSLIDTIIEKDPELTLFFKALKYTTRDGKLLNDGDNFDDAYAGNYEELFSAFIEVIKINNFFTKIIGSFK